MFGVQMERDNENTAGFHAASIWWLETRLQSRLNEGELHFISIHSLFFVPRIYRLRGFDAACAGARFEFDNGTAGFFNGPKHCVYCATLLHMKSWKHFHAGHCVT